MLDVANEGPPGGASGTCPGCGYNGRGLAADAKCPECGTVPERG
jgi:rubrerythrin